jgi:sulfonate transport system substrate-binding protein
MRAVAHGALRIAVVMLTLAGIGMPNSSLLGSKARSLIVAGRHNVLEVGPILFAADRLGAGGIVYRTGSVADLYAKGDERADVAGNAETQALRISVDNPDLRIVFTIAEGLYRIVARRSAGVGILADLKGKRIGTSPATSAHYYLHRLLVSAGLSEADVTIVPLSPVGLADALIDKKVDAISIWEPESERAMAALDADAVDFQEPGVYREIYNLNTTADALADPVRRAQIVTFLRALIEAAKIGEKEPDRIWPLLVKSGGFDPKLVAASWHHHRFPARLAPDLLDVMEQQEVWLAGAEKRAARNRADLAKLIDTSVLDEALR